jgi:SAM-dependent methyltransferase
MPPDSTQRFSDRVGHYARYRPTYPAQILDVLRQTVGLEPSDVVADVGSGTGISSELFLRNGNTVYAIEPNAPMRAAAESALSPYPNFHSVDGTSTATGLPDASVDLITAMQAFHWFDPPATRQEFQRILRPSGHVVLVWNDRRLSATPFLEAYEQLLLDFGTDYQRVRHNNLSAERLAEFFGPGGYSNDVLPNEQQFDLDGLTGRLLSSSYVPAQDHPAHATMLRRLGDIFERYSENGTVRMIYDTRIFTGRLSG